MYKISISYLKFATYLKHLLTILMLNNFYLETYLSIKKSVHKSITLPVVLYGCETWSLSH
jgi:hypothetical protein